MRVTVLFAIFAKGQHGRSILEQLHSDENMKITHIHLRFFKSFLLNTRNEAPESTTICHSIGFVEVGAGITQASAGE